jgi:hypothetical protein
MIIKRSFPPLPTCAYSVPYRLAPLPVLLPVDHILSTGERYGYVSHNH